MSRRGVALVLAAVVLAGVLAAVWGGPGPALGSVRSRGPAGWLAARRYLEGRRLPVALLSAPEQLDAAGDPGVLVVVFPWQHTPVIETVDFIDRIERHLGRGGDLVLGYSGGVPGFIENQLTELSWKEARRPPRLPWRWRSFVREEWDLPATSALPGGPPLRLWAPRYLPVPPAGTKVLYASPQGQPVAGVFRHGRGRVIFLPADVFANARLAQAANGNADLLETLARWLARQWTFDEFHHGLTLAAPAESARVSAVFDLVLLHLALLYLLAVLSLARRQGPAWREPPARTGSAASFLLGLGELHHRLGHHAEAARLLLARARELDPGLRLPETLEGEAARANAARLVEIAKTVARLRRGHRSNAA